MGRPVLLTDKLNFSTLPWRQGTVAPATTTTATKEGSSAATAPKEGNPISSGGSAEATNKKLPRLIFITEYMSSGSLKQFLRKTKRNNRSIQLKSWKRWVTQILYALSYLHQASYAIFSKLLLRFTILPI